MGSVSLLVLLCGIFFGSYNICVIANDTPIVIDQQAINVDNNIFLVDENEEIQYDGDHASSREEKQPIDDYTDDNDQNMNGNDNNNKNFINKMKNNHKLTDILVACFFFIAAVWLLLATIYSVILLILLRMQARGELDVYDEDLGRVTFGHFTFNFGCILRRYAIQLEEDYNQQMQRRFRNPTSSEENQVDEERPPIRFMHREERRNAMKELLGFENITLNKQNGVNITEKVGGCTKSPMNSSLDLSLSSSDEGPICSICLTEYKSTDLIFQSNICPHKFHQECLLSWLERRNNTECPCCRKIIVSDEDVWDVVQKLRKERRKKESGLFNCLMKSMKSKKAAEDKSTSNSGGRSSSALNMIQTESAEIDTSSNEELVDGAN